MTRQRQPAFLPANALRAALVLVLFGAVIAYFAYLRYGDDLTRGGTSPDDVLVMLVVRGEDDILLPRIIDRYTYVDGSYDISSQNVLARVAIPGTDRDTLRDIYPFAGGKGVAEALANEKSVPAYIVLDQSDLEVLIADVTIDLIIVEQMEVFDGDSLFTFRPGAVSLDAQEVVALHKGAEHLRDPIRAQMLADLGKQLAGRLGKSSLGYETVKTDLTLEQFDLWQQRFR